jgi:hypothetical protein
MFCYCIDLNSRWLMQQATMNLIWLSNIRGSPVGDIGGHPSEPSRKPESECNEHRVDLSERSELLTARLRNERARISDRLEPEGDPQKAIAAYAAKSKT